MGNNILLESFGNIQLYAVRKADELGDTKEYLKHNKVFMAESTANESTVIMHRNCTDFYLVNGRNKHLIGSTYRNFTVDGGKENFVGQILTLKFPKEALTGLTEEMKAKITSDVMYTAYFVNTKNANLKGIREYYEVFKMALDSRNLKAVKQELKRGSIEVSYTDLRVMILEYFSTTMGLDCYLEFYKKYNYKLRNYIVTSVLSEMNYGRYIDMAKLNRLFRG